MSDAYEHGVQLLEAKQLQEATVRFQEVIAAEPQNAQAIFMLGVCHYRGDQLENAMNCFQQATDIDNLHYRAWYYQALCQERLGQTENAIASLKFSLTLKPGFSKAQQKLHNLEQPFLNHPQKKGINSAQRLLIKNRGKKLRRPHLLRLAFKR